MSKTTLIGMNTNDKEAFKDVMTEMFFHNTATNKFFKIIIANAIGVMRLIDHVPEMADLEFADIRRYKTKRPPRFETEFITVIMPD